METNFHTEQLSFQSRWPLAQEIFNPGEPLQRVCLCYCTDRL